jgi:16S rRNA G527 N7-methylase RsmG
VVENQKKNKKFQDLITEENKNWNLVDHEKE